MKMNKREALEDIIKNGGDCRNIPCAQCPLSYGYSNTGVSSGNFSCMSLIYLYAVRDFDIKGVNVPHMDKPLAIAIAKSLLSNMDNE